MNREKWCIMSYRANVPDVAYPIVGSIGAPYTVLIYLAERMNERYSDTLYRVEKLNQCAASSYMSCQAIAS